MITRRTRIAILLGMIGSYFVGTGVVASDAIDGIAVLLLAMLLLSCEAVAGGPRRPKRKPLDPDAEWRRAAEDRANE